MGGGGQLWALSKAPEGRHFKVSFMSWPAPDHCSKSPHSLTVILRQPLMAAEASSGVPTPHTRTSLSTPAWTSVSTQNKAQAPQQGLQGPSHWGLLSPSAVAHSLWTQHLGPKSPWSRGCQCLEPVSMPFTLPGLLFLSPPPSQADVHSLRAPHPEDSREILLVRTLILDKNTKGQGLHFEGKSRDSSLRSPTSRHCSPFARELLSPAQTSLPDPSQCP